MDTSSLPTNYIMVNNLEYTGVFFFTREKGDRIVINYEGHPNCRFCQQDEPNRINYSPHYGICQNCGTYTPPGQIWPHMILPSTGKIKKENSDVK